MNVIEKIIAQKAHLESVKAGDEVTVSVDLAAAHDVTGPIAIEQFKRTGAKRVFNESKVVFVIDHNIPCASVDSRIQHRAVREFCAEYGTSFYGRSEGVIHQVLSEEKLYAKGDIVVGADSHTCTAGAYGAIAIPVGSTELAAVMALGTLDMEVPEVNTIVIDGTLKKGVYAKDVILTLIGQFGTGGFTDEAVVLTGSTVLAMTDSERMTLANMMIEMGAMIGYIDDGAEPVGETARTCHISAQDIVPVAACPASPGNVKPLSEVAGTRIDQAVIGSCTNGRYADMLIAAEVFKHHRAAAHVNLIVVPASKNIADQMDAEGLTKIFRDAGAVITNPGCGPCFGAHQGLLSETDTAISTTNRNFPGRMGHKHADIYLASPRAVAESAVAGVIAAPGTVLALED